MNHYIKTLHEHSKQVSLRHEAERQASAAVEASVARERLSLLDDRLKLLLAAIPTEVQSDGLSLMALQPHFRGRGQGHMRCHVGEIGSALRRLGFRRERRWRKDAEGFRALWYPAKTHL